MATFNKKKYSSYNFQTAVHAIIYSSFIWNNNILFLERTEFMKRRKIQYTWYSLHNLSFHNYLPEWRWLVVDIYQAAKRWGKYPSLATNTLVNGFFKYKLKQWNNIAQKADFASLQRLQYYRTQMPNELLRGEQQSIFRVWVANQSAPIHFF